MPLAIPVGDGWLGRVCNGRGEPLDGGPPVFGATTAPVNGYPLNPTWRQPPAEPVLTGISAIDALTTLVRGQKLPVFSVAGLPHLELAAQIAAQASAGGEPFSVVFAAMGLTHADADLVRDTLEERSASGELVLLLNTADDPVIERVLTPRLALTVAEHLAFERRPARARGHGRHDQLRRGAARGVGGARARSRPAAPIRATSTATSPRSTSGAGGCAGPPGLGHRAAGADHAGRGHHPPGARPDRLHHRGPDRAVAELHARRHLPAGRPAVLAVPADAQRRGGRPHARGPPGPRRPAPGGARPGAAGRELAELVGAAALSATDRQYVAFATAFEQRLLDQGRDEQPAPGGDARPRLAGRCPCCPAGS